MFKSRAFNRAILLAFSLLPGVSLAQSTNNSGYCSVSANSTYEWIGGLNLGSDISYSASQTPSNSGYRDLTHLSTTHKLGEVTKFNAAPAFKSTIYPEHFSLYIDWNQDKTFDASEKIFTILSTTTKDSTEFGIPEHAKIGTTRARVIMHWKKTVGPCGGIGYGEVLDFGFNIQTASQTKKIKELTALRRQRINQLQLVNAYRLPFLASVGAGPNALQMTFSDNANEFYYTEKPATRIAVSQELTHPKFMAWASGDRVYVHDLESYASRVVTLSNSINYSSLEVLDLAFINSETLAIYSQRSYNNKLNTDNTIRVFDLKNGDKEIQKIELGQGSTQFSGKGMLAFSNINHNKILAASRANNPAGTEILFFIVDNNKLYSFTQLPARVAAGHPVDMTFVKNDGRSILMLATSHSSNHVYAVNPKDLKVVNSPTLGYYPQSILYSLRRGSYFVALYGANEIVEVNINSNLVVGRYKLPISEIVYFSNSVMTISHDGSKLFVATTNYSAKEPVSSKVFEITLAATTNDSLHNSTCPKDVNNDGKITSMDALLIINHLSKAQTTGAAISGPPYLDVNNDSMIDQTDTDLVIQALISNQRSCSGTGG